jgi:hypothetical protein
MGTRSHIGVENPDGTVTYVYCHYDGYPEGGVGEKLVEMDETKARDVIGQGDMRSIGEPFASFGESWQCVRPRKAASVGAYQDEGGNVSYTYLLNASGRWLVQASFGAGAGSLADLRQVLGMPEKSAGAGASSRATVVQSDPLEETIPMRTNEITGFRVIHIPSGRAINHDGNGYHWISNVGSVEPEAVPRGDAFRRLAAYLDTNPNQPIRDFEVKPVYRESTPIEDASSELAGLLEGLCTRHGLNLGLSRKQMEAQIGKELAQLGVGGSTFVATGIPRR